MNNLIIGLITLSLIASSTPLPDAVSGATSKGTPTVTTPQTNTTATQTKPPTTTTTKDSAVKATPSIAIPNKNFTLEEVAKFTGKNGTKKYVVISAIVYDVTKTSEFKSGIYKGMKVGTDITAAFNKLSTAKTLIKKFIPVGKLVKSSDPKKTTPTASTALVLTSDQLEKYNGKNGQPAYVAVDGVIYDVSKLKQWRYGNHYEGIEAGKDLSEEINESPHGKAILSEAEVVGTLKKED